MAILSAVPHGSSQLHSSRRGACTASTADFRCLTQGAPAPGNEVDREAALCRLDILDTNEDARFNDITQLVPP